MQRAGSAALLVCTFCMHPLQLRLPLLAHQLSATGGIEIEAPQTPWPDFKSSTLFGQLPHMRVDGLEISQSMAIARVLSRRAKLEGASEADFSMSEMLMEQFCDVIATIGSATHSEDKYDICVRTCHFVMSCLSYFPAVFFPPFFVFVVNLLPSLLQGCRLECSSRQIDKSLCTRQQNSRRQIFLRLLSHRRGAGNCCCHQLHN